MDCVLNETTRTVHKVEPGVPELHAECGVAYHLDPDQLQKTSVTRAEREIDATKCGRCFENGGEY